LPICNGSERLKKNGKKVHSTQKPEALLHRILLAPANKNDLDLYHGMGVSFLCNATRKGFDLDFPKTLNVASATFASVISQKHGGKIIERKKEQTVDIKKLQFIASLQLVESALQVCPDNVPEKIEKQFKIETERLKKLQGLGKK